VFQRVTELPSFPTRPSDAHKGTFGKVLIVGGSRGMTGAACLAGLGALRGGAGLVYVAVPSEVVAIVAGVEPSYLTIPLPTDASTGQIAVQACTELEQRVADKDVMALGPGLGTSQGPKQIVAWAYARLEQPLVVDADGLNVLARQPELMQSGGGPRILTPHPGEFARLVGKDLRSVLGQREDLAVSFAAQHGVVLVLKGHRTLITDGDRLAVNPTGNSGMATGGSGDVLTGLIAALLAQRCDSFAAAQLGAYLHGRAGDLAAEELSEPGLIASDLPRYLARAWKEIQSGA